VTCTPRHARAARERHRTRIWPGNRPLRRCPRHWSGRPPDITGRATEILAVLHNEQLPHHPGPAVAYAATVRSLIAAITAQASPSQGHHMTKGRRRIPVAPRSA